MRYAGWDWATQVHDVSVVDEDGRVVDRWTCEHSEQGLRECMKRLACHGEPAELAVAIELNRGLVVDRLLAAGHPVVPIHPASFFAVRGRWGTAGAKSDAGDSYQLADYLRTDGHRLRRLRPVHPVTWELRSLTRARDDLLKSRVAAIRRLQAVLEEHWPGPLRLFSRLDANIALAFLDAYPNPDAAAHLGASRMTAFLRRNRYPGVRSGAELVDRLRSAPVAGGILPAAAVAAVVRSKVAQIRCLVAEEAKLERSIKDALARHPRTALFENLPRVATVNLGQLMGEVAAVLETAGSVEEASSHLGMTPVTKASGKGRSVHFRWTVNGSARKAMTSFVNQSRFGSTWANDLYLAARARGARHPHAVRIVGRGWIRVMWACWHSGVPYDPERHAAGRLNRAESCI